jgi:hypothetical protein
MELQDQEKFAKALIVLAEILPKQLSPVMIEGYFDALVDFTYAELEWAMRHAVRTYKFFPTPVELRELLEGSPADQAQQAWHQLLLALHRIGTYHSLLCEDGVLSETIRRVFGSWPEAAYLPRPEGHASPAYQARRKEFLDTYRTLRRQPEPFNAYLVGRFEAENTAASSSWTKGILPEPVVFWLPTCGEPQKRLLRDVLPDHPLVKLAFPTREPLALSAAEQEDAPGE